MENSSNIIEIIDDAVNSDVIDLTTTESSTTNAKCGKFPWDQCNHEYVKTHLISTVFRGLNAGSVECPGCKKSYPLITPKCPFGGSKDSSQGGSLIFQCLNHNCNLKLCLACGFDCDDSPVEMIPDETATSSSSFKNSNSNRYGRYANDSVTFVESLQKTCCLVGKYTLLAIILQSYEEHCLAVVPEKSSPTIQKARKRQKMAIPSSSSLFDADLEACFTFACSVFPTGIGQDLHILLKTSRLFREAYNLLRNDSVSDILTRSSLFLALFKFLDFVANDPDAIKLINEHPPSLGTDSDSDSDSKSSSPSCLDLFEFLVKQSSVYEQTMKKSFNDEIQIFPLSNAASNDQLVIEAIRRTNNNLLAATSYAPILLKDNDYDDQDSNGIQLEGNLLEKLKSLAFGHSAISQHHTFSGSDWNQSTFHPTYYYKRPSQISNAPVTNRLGRIAKEIASLSTNLPTNENSSIFVLADEDRFDLLKAIITGPVGTPYENGVFEFDIFLPSEYPYSPPKVNFLTTKHGSIRFNPNLYQNGKVCLSLLGTWQGNPDEMWNPGKSTILQVLLSIQSLILVDLPYFNEPGYGVPNAKNASSISYNKNIRRYTLDAAILAMLRNPPALWARHIRLHFKSCKAKLREQCNNWLKMDKSVSNLVSAILKELEKY